MESLTSGLVAVQVTLVDGEVEVHGVVGMLVGQLLAALGTETSYGGAISSVTSPCVV